MPSGVISRTFGTVSADKQREMTGLEFVQGLAGGTVPLNTIAKTLGYDVTKAESGRVVVTAEPKDIHPKSGWHRAWRSCSHNAR